MDKIAPAQIRLVTQKDPRPWLNASLRAERASLRKLERHWRAHQSEQTSLQLKTALNLYYNRIDKARQLYLQKKITSQAQMPKQLFATFNTLLKPKSKHSPENSNLTADDFANFFNQKIQLIANNFSIQIQPQRASTKKQSVLPDNYPIIYDNKFVFRQITELETKQILLTSRPTTCPSDPFPSFLYSTLTPLLLPFITHLINCSLKQGIFPDSFKQAILHPILKKPSLDQNTCCNYRPVSLLPFLSKVLEKAVFNQLTAYLNKYHLYDPLQSGFRTNHSTETALNIVLNDILVAKAQGLSTVLILLDLSAAFDTLDHQILLTELSTIGLSDLPLQWFQSFLSSRSYKVSYQNNVSAATPLSIGVPQGAVLSPLLFSLYIRPLGRLLSTWTCSYHMYADDIQIYKSFKQLDTSAGDFMSERLTMISIWMFNHRLKLNMEKTELLIFRPDHPQPPIISPNIYLQDHLLVPATSAKDLGVTLETRLSMQSFIESTTKSCHYHLLNIRKIRQYLSIETARSLVQALVTSRLDYCNSLLAGLPKYSLQPLISIQNFAVRVVYNRPKFSHITNLRRSLHWLPIQARIQYKLLVLAFKALRFNTPKYLSDSLSPYAPSRELRSTEKQFLTINQTGTAKSKIRAFQDLVPHMWNALPQELRSEQDLPHFRKNLKTFLFNS